MLKKIKGNISITFIHFYFINSLFKMNQILEKLVGFHNILGACPTDPRPLLT